MQLWEKVDSVVLRNFHDYWEDPLINKHLGDEASKHYEGILIIRENKKPVWLSHPFNYTQAKTQFKKKAIVEKYNSIEDIKKILRKYCKKRVGYNPRHQTVVSFRNLKKFLRGKILIDVGNELETEREIKTSEEVKNLETAIKETRKVIKLAKKWLKIGITEKAIDEKVRKQFDGDGFDTAFCTVAFKENTSHIHHTATQKKLEYGPVLIDTGAKYKGYCADITETFYFGEENPSVQKTSSFKEFIETKTKVAKCIKKIESMLAPNTKAKKLWETAEKIAGKQVHALGHGIGIEVHDFPIGIGQKSRFLLKEGMVLAIEPALYNKKLGVRIENDYLITKNGFKKLG
ncbi:MAG: Xaa-Pro peptidase family protein [Candidatus Diapherotrites archaeon]|nr:Xaa-Pro peptidase family protein [Candidatus Diapherotrites archaeon]